MDGEIEVGSLLRLADALTDSSGTLRFVVSGEVGANGDVLLVMVVRGALALRCQRCLEPFRFPVSVRRRFLLVDEGEQWPDDELTDDGVDAIAAERAMDLTALVEQEMILALPLAPRHDICAAPRAVDDHGDEAKRSAFAALAALKRGE